MDSTAQAGKWALQEGLMLNRITYLEDARPRWYEKPGFLVPVTALVTIWAVLRTVDISK